MTFLHDAPGQLQFQGGPKSPAASQYASQIVVITL